MLSLGALSLSSLAEPLNFGHRMRAEFGYDDNLLESEEGRAREGDLFAKLSPMVTIWKEGFLLQYEARLKKNAVHRGEDTNHHLLTGQLRTELDRSSSLVLEGKARMRYAESAPFDNNLYSVSGDLERLLAPLTSVSFGVRFGKQVYIDRQQLSWIGGTATSGLRHRLSRDLGAWVDYSAGLRRYGRDAIVQTEPSKWDTLRFHQQDWSHSMAFRLERFWPGLVAEAQGRLVRNSSNSEPYSYWSALIALCLVKGLGPSDVLEIHGSLLAKRYDVPWLGPEEHPVLDPEEGKDQSALILRFVHDLTGDLSLGVYYRHLRREGRFPGRYYRKNDIGFELCLKS